MHSFLCFYLFLVVIIWKTICNVVQYAVHMELCSTNLFFQDFLLFIGTFFNKTLLKLSHYLTLLCPQQF